MSRIVVHTIHGLPRMAVAQCSKLEHLVVIIIKFVYIHGREHVTCDKRCPHSPPYIQVHLCDQRLKAIKVPDIITRPPQSLLEFNHWKG